MNWETNMVDEAKGTESKRSPFWLLAFLVLNAVGLGLIVWGVAFRQIRLEDMQIVRYTPQGEVSREDTGEVMLEFSQPLDAKTITESSITLVPRVQGHVEQVGDKQLKFVLTDPLERATRYKIVLAPSLRGSRSESMGEYHCEFNTAPLAVEEVAQGSVDVQGGINLDIKFNAKVDPRDLRRALSMKYADNHNVDFNVRGRLPAQRLQVHLPRLAKDVVHLVIGQNLSSVEGPLSLKEKYHAVIKMTAEPSATTLEVPKAGELAALPPPLPQVDHPKTKNVVYVSQKVCFTGIRTDTDYGNNRIIIKANAPFDAAEARNFIHIEPAISHSFKTHYSGLVIEGDFEPAKRYQVTLKKGLPAGIAGALETTITRTVWFPDRGEDLEFTFGGGYLSPKGLMMVPLKGSNVREAELTVRKLYPENIVEYVLTGENGISFGRSTELVRHTLQFSAAPNKYEEKLLDLRKLVEQKPAGVYSLTAHSKTSRWRSTSAVVAVSDLGITTRIAGDSVLCWITSLSSAKPVPGANVALYSNRRQKLGNGATDENGLCRITYAKLPQEESPAVVVVQKGGDTSYLGFSNNQRTRGSLVSSGRPYLLEGYEAFLTAERGVYRPGDTVHLSAFVRAKELQTPEEMPLDLLVRRPDGREFIRKRVTCDKQGRISGDIAIPISSVTGYYAVLLTLPGETKPIGETGFRIEDYIPQTLSMKLDWNNVEKFPAADRKLSLTASVKHLFGQPAKGLKVTGKVVCRPELFSPKGWKEYRFIPSVMATQKRKANLPQQVLGEGGKAEFSVGCLLMANAPVVRATVEVTAHEQGGRALSESINHKFYPWNFYLGIKSPSGSLKPEQQSEFDLAFVGRDGTKHTQEISWEATLYSVNWSNVLRKQGDGRIVYDWSRKEKQIKKFTGKAQGDSKLFITPDHPGHYLLTVKADGTYPVSQEFYVSGKDGESWVKQDPDELKLLADSKRYEPGQTAKVSLQAPFAGTALVCVEGGTVLSRRVQPLQKGINHLEFKVDEKWRPNVYVSVTLVRAVKASKKWLPHRASGVVRLPVDCSQKKLRVKIDSAPSVRPAQKAGFTVQVSNPDGAPAANAAVVFAAVDMGVLALDGFKPENPWDFFYALRRLDVREADMYSRLAPELSQWKLAKKAEPGGGDGWRRYGAAIGRRLNPVKARRVKTAVLYNGSLVTNAVGTVQIDFPMPEYIGELKLMVLAADAESFGMAEKPLPVKAPLMYRASWPRFLAPGDTCTVSVTLFNKTGADGDIALDFVSAQNLELLQSGEQVFSVKSGEQKIVELQVKATGVGVGKARLKASLGAYEFAQGIELPVRPAAAFSRYSKLSVIKPGATEKIAIAGDYLPDGFKGNLTVTSNPVASVSGSLNYLLRYPYGCLEQTTSKMLPLIYMPDLAGVISPGAIGRAEISTLVDSGLQRLRSMQTWGGGLSMWSGGEKPAEWATIYATDFLVEAQKAGYTIPADLLTGTLDYLSNQIGTWTRSTSSSGIPDRLDVASYAAYVLCRAGRPPHTWLATLEEILQASSVNRHTSSQTARCYLAAAYLACGETKAAAQFMQGLPSFVASRSLGGTLNSPAREKAIFLSTLLDIDPKSAQIPALVSSLKVRLSDPWQASTQENAFALLALGKYARSIKIDPDAKAKVVVDGAEEVFNSAHGKSFTLIKPGQTATVSNNGNTPLYVYGFCEGVPASGKVEEKDSGLSVRRYITDMDGNSVNGELKQGTLYRVNIALNTPRNLDNLVLVDLLAAGLEIENQDLRGAARMDTAVKRKRMVLMNVEKRDDRVILFADVFEGKATYSYVVRAVSPGDFDWPACDASAMYDPAVFSINGRGRLKVVK